MPCSCDCNLKKETRFDCNVINNQTTKTIPFETKLFDMVMFPFLSGFLPTVLSMLNCTVQNFVGKIANALGLRKAFYYSLSVKV